MVLVVIFGIGKPLIRSGEDQANPPARAAQSRSALMSVPCEILNAFRPLLLHLEIRSRYLGTLVSYFGTT